MLLTVTAIERERDFAAPPDLLWNGSAADFRLDQVRGLASNSPLETAVILLLFTDAPADPVEMSDGLAGDFRGYPGDGVSGERPLGSKLWLYRRQALTDQVIAAIKAEIKRALEPLLDQRVAVRIDVETEADKPRSRLNIGISIYGRDGAKKYNESFEFIWRGR